MQKQERSGGCFRMPLHHNRLRVPLGQDMSLFLFNKLFSLHSLSIYYVPERKQSVSIFNFSLKMIKKKKEN